MSATRPALVIARYTLLEAVRNRLAWLVLAVLVAGVGLAEFIGEVAIAETVQFQAAFLGAMLRGCAVFVLALVVITSVVREFNEKGVDLILSLPIPRVSYYAGKLLGFSVLALLTAAISAVGLLLYAPPGAAVMWAASLTCELLIVTAFSLLCLFTFSQVTVAISTVMAFYVVSRAMDAILLIGHNPIAGSGSLSHRVIVQVLEAIAFVLPELHRFTRTEWLVYHDAVPAELLPVAGQTAVYLLLVSGAALLDLYRKNL